MAVKGLTPSDNTVTLSPMATGHLERARSYHAHDAYCRRQAARLRFTLASAADRYQRRLAQEVQQDRTLRVINRGIPQAWHRQDWDPT